jgi:hypothetical protein
LKADYKKRFKKWTDNDEQILKKEYKKGTDVAEISKKLNKSSGSIKAKAHDLKITHIENRFTKEQIKYIIENKNKLTYKEIGEKLNKTEANLCRKFKELGIKKGKITKKWWSNATPAQLQQWKIKQRNTKIKNGTLNPMLKQEIPYSRTKGGKRKDLNNIYFRSSWEANIARYYNFLGIEWQFEPKTFVFANITRGSVSYTPDFYLPKEDKWVEVKGWMDGKSKTKLKRFKKQYPEEYAKLQLITEKEYKEIKRKIAPFIKEWE